MAILGLACVSIHGPAAARSPRARPIIDIHVHASSRDRDRPVAVCPGDQEITFNAVDPRDAYYPAKASSCANPIYSPLTSDELRRGTIAALLRNNARHAVLTGRPEVVALWRKGYEALFIPAGDPGSSTPAQLDRLRSLIASRAVDVIFEVGFQYQGKRADNPALEPFWALAEQRDIPVGIHLGESVPGGAREPGPNAFRPSLTTPFQLEDVLRKHPRLRVYVCHYGSPLVDEMIAMLYFYPNLYVDISANDWNSPRAQFYDHLKRMVDAGFSKRILFGSDQTAFPQGIDLAVPSVAAAPFLNAAQKRDISYNNAARFLRLSPAQIAADHRPLRP
ncbi:MAG: amidohydrolase family protein [Sphingomonas sp.]|nr:amidohydrolase family protein [Sphingomonas sp.]